MFILFLRENPMIKQCISKAKFWFKNLSKTKQQLIWFFGLWIAGFLSIFFISLIIKLLMKPFLGS